VKLDNVLSLDDIRSTDLGATPPDAWWERWICHVLSKMTGKEVKTIHWFKFVRLGRDSNGEERWIISESITKGTALDFCYYPLVYVYGIKGLDDTPDLPDVLEDIHAEFGRLPYDWGGNFLTGLWWLAKHYFGIITPVIHDKAVNCQWWVCLLAYFLGERHDKIIKLIPDNEYPDCVNLEYSPHLDYRGELHQ